MMRGLQNSISNKESNKPKEHYSSMAQRTIRKIPWGEQSKRFIMKHVLKG